MDFIKEWIHKNGLKRGKEFALLGVASVLTYRAP